jgi:hypothetical protein
LLLQFHNKPLSVNQGSVQKNRKSIVRIRHQKGENKCSMILRTKCNLQCTSNSPLNYHWICQLKATANSFFIKCSFLTKWSANHCAVGSVNVPVAQQLSGRGVRRPCLSRNTRSPPKNELHMSRSWSPQCSAMPVHMLCQTPVNKSTRRVASVAKKKKDK